MAAEGLRFSDGYANSPVCSPTRLALMTGRWQYRLRGGADEPIASGARGSPVLGMPPEHPTLASLLRDAGYTTALIGKWHLGYPPTFGPPKSGYQEFFGVIAGGVDYFTHCDPAGVHDLYDGAQEVHLKGYQFLFDLARDARERANLARREPARLEAMKARYREWAASIPPVPADAAVSLLYDRTTMALP